MIAILADIHGNAPALEAVVTAMPEVKEAWILGDTLGELPFPLETLACLERLRERSLVRMVAGNREISLLEAYRGEHPDWWKGSQMRALAWTADQIDSEGWNKLAMLTPVVRVDTIPGGAVLCHGTTEKVRGMIRTEEQAMQEVQKQPQDLLACGHTHNAKLFRFGQKMVVNAGSAGIALDGFGGTACYVLIDEQKAASEAGRAEIRYVSYDLEKTIREIHNRGLTELAPGVMRAVILELQTGKHHLMGLAAHCNAYAERYLGRPVAEVPPELWKEAEQKWDGSEYRPVLFENQ